MTSRKPDLCLPLREGEQPDFQRPASSLRSPRFIENFNAPFSEAIMNASRTTLATDALTSPSTNQNERTSFGDESARRPSFGTKDTGYSHALPPGPLRIRNSSWDSETKRRANINDRIREWARKSWGAVRSRSDVRTSYFDSNPHHRRSIAVLLSSPGDVSPSASSDGYGQVGGFPRAAVTNTHLPVSSSN